MSQTFSPSSVLLFSLAGKFPKLCLASKPPLDEDEDYKYFFNGSLSVTGSGEAAPNAEQNADKNSPREAAALAQQSETEIEIEARWKSGVNLWRPVHCGQKLRMIRKIFCRDFTGVLLSQGV